MSKNVCNFKAHCLCGMPPKIYAANVEQHQEIAATKPARTEKQIAAAEKAKLRRQAKKMLAQETPKEAPVPPVDEKVKKPRKRKQENKEADTSSETVETLVNEPVAKSKKTLEKPLEMEKEKELVEAPPVEEKKLKKKPRAPKAPKADDEPPKWFKSYIMGVKEEQARMSATKIPKKQVRFEADQEANEKWCEPVTRERVNRSVDHHMQSLYSMVFPNRKF